MKKNKTPIQIRFKDLDSLGHVNNANYITYFELARFEYFKVVMGSKTVQWDTEGVIIASISMNFKAPVLIEDEISVYTWISRMGTKSFDMACSIVKVKNGKETEVANGSTVLVCLNYKTGQTIEIPEVWKQKMKEFENQVIK